MTLHNVHHVVKKHKNHDFKLLINGKLTASLESFDVFNPATGEKLNSAPAATLQQLDEAIDAASKAFISWSALPWQERGGYLRRFADALDEQRLELITLLTLEQGKPLRTMATQEVDAAIYWIREVSKRQLKDKLLESTPDHDVWLRYKPLGVVGAITPWNFPVLLSLWKVAPCLITGNTMVLKPSPYTPLTSLFFGEIAARVLPAGVLNVVSGGNELGQHMTEHPDIHKISFTGSTATGKKVVSSGSVNLKRVTLELGGNDPAILLPDADWKKLIPTLFDAAFGNSGQWCIAVKRLYVHNDYYDEFLREFAAYAESKVVGNGLDEETDLGPIQNKMQFDKIKNLLDDIREQGYKVVTGGEIDESRAGNFVPVTLIDNPPEDSRIVQEEPFGPLLPVIRYKDIDDAIRRANNTPFGLGASVWGSDHAQANEVGGRLQAGTVWVNEIHIHGIDIPFGGHKQSGLGVENGEEGLAGFTNLQTFMSKK